VHVLDVPGHTHGHIAFWIPELGICFCGDTLFALGCGRVFEGTHDQMWQSLLRLRALPDATNLFCAHEYTRANADFAITIEPDNIALQERVAEIKASASRPTVPMLLATEKATNPFLRADHPDTQHALNMAGARGTDVFSTIRTQKDNF
ncbi:MAG: hydroxyacylglutathione hydrolase, partial [Pseudomonadota bacterium]